MKKLLQWLIGYTVLKVKREDLREIFNTANAKNIQILDIKENDEFAYVRLYSKYAEKIETASDIRYYGLPCIFKRYFHRFGLIVGFLAFFSILCISPMFVWEINIRGLEKISLEEISSVLSTAGIEIGTFSPKILRSDVYSRVLLENKNISWISVNISGGIANVEIIEREYTEVSDNLADGANIIASCDGQIIDTDIKSGRRVVKDGDIVKKGDLLVSGIYDSVKMGTRYVYSDAKVNAHVFEEYSLEVPLKTRTKRYGEEEVTDVSVKIFKKRINIFEKNTPNAGKCDIIKVENYLPLKGFERLPVTLEKTCVIPYFFEELLFTEEHALELAKKDVADMLSNAGYEEIISVNENYYTENGQLHFTCEVEAIKNIALVSEFEID